MYSVQISLHSDHDLIVAREAARRAARSLGADRYGVTLAATVTSELARNVLQHAGWGDVTLSTRGEGLTIETHDQGPGIADPRKAIKPGYSTDGSLGMGLSMVAKIASSLEMTGLQPQGTAVRAVVPADRLSVRPSACGGGRRGRGREGRAGGGLSSERCAVATAL